MVTGLSVAALGIGATFVTAFTASLADAGPAEGGLRSALVNTFHELGGAGPGRPPAAAREVTEMPGSNGDACARRGNEGQVTAGPSSG